MPALAVSPAGSGVVQLYASWNGATDVTGWRVIAGPSPTALSQVGWSARRGFETPIVTHEGLPYFAVQALGTQGQVLATSPTVATGPHIAVFGANAFVAGNAMGGLPTVCYLPKPCHVTTRVYSGRTLVARTGPEYIQRGGAGTLYFRLSRGAFSTLSRRRRLGVRVVARDASGVSATTNMTLIPYSTSGPAPHRSLNNTPTVQIEGTTDFVSSNGWGGILDGCFDTAPCHLKAIVSVGNTTIASTGSEFLGADELGYSVFRLTSAGQAMLAHAPGNQLAAHVTVTGGGVTANADIALIRYR
jgi:hypothetical protein